MQEFAWLKHDELFEKWDPDRIWLKYCGFFDLSLSDFMVIQESLLKDQIALLAKSKIGRVIMGERVPASVEEFRRTVPLTTYEDYEPYLGRKLDEAVPVKPAIWAHTSGRAGLMKWAPYTPGTLERLASDTLSAFILSSAKQKGDVLLKPGAKVVLNLPPVPYTTGIMAMIAGHRIRYQAIPPIEQADQMEFQERIEHGFRTALNTGADYAASIAVVLAKVGESFGKLGNERKASLAGLHPPAMVRLVRARLRSKIARRPMLPRDIWKMKGLVCGGTDVSILRDQIEYYWGVQPLDVYVATETGYVAMQAWNKKAMTLIPYSNFYEFISEEERRKSASDKSYRPTTVLIDQLEAGKTYELVITNFQGGPFARYRIGDLIKVSALRDDEAKVNLPQITFQCRADDIIDIAGFSRFDEKTIWRAIQDTGVPYEDWTARKEAIDGKPCLHLYIELHDGAKGDMTSLVDQQLSAGSQDYRDLKKIGEAQPLKVTILQQGTMKRFLAARQAAGFDLAHLKPAHVNAPDATIQELLSLSNNS